jgi:hypothetical protein
LSRTIAIAMTMMNNVSFDEAVECRAMKPIKTRSSRLYLLVASSVLTFLLMVMDSSLPQEWALRAVCEFAFYAMCMCAALFYVRSQSAGQVCAAEAARAEASRECDDSSKRDRGVFHQLRLAMFLDFIAGARAAAATALRRMLGAVSELARELAPPQRRASRPAEERPFLPMWSVKAAVCVSITLSIALLVAAFNVGSGCGSASSFFDAAPRSPGCAWRSTLWLVAAFWMSSGLCAIHPLQSAFVLSF